MSIVSDTEILDFVGVTDIVFEVTALCDVLVMKYDGGANTNCDIADGTYDPDQMATAIKTAIDTAFTIASTVTWSSTTNKFTIAAPAGHTLAYVNTGSDAGALIGFDQDHAAAASLTSDNAIGDPSAIVLAMRDAIEVFVQKYCRRTFASTTYTLEKYSGIGSQYLFLNNKPVTTISLLSVGSQDAMYIYNSYDYSYATVSVTSTGISLDRDGSNDSTLTFAAYTTISAMVTAINAVGSGWVASVASSEYNNFKTTLLLKRFGASAIDSNYVYLKIPNEPIYDFEVFEDLGVIYYGPGFPIGNNNIFVSYVAGEANEDIKLAIKLIVKNMYSKQYDETWGLDSYRVGDITRNFATALVSNAELAARAVPPEALLLLNLNRRILI